MTYGQRLIAIGAITFLQWHEFMARHLAQRRQHARIKLPAAQITCRGAYIVGDLLDQLRALLDILFTI